MSIFRACELSIHHDKLMEVRTGRLVGTLDGRLVGLRVGLAEGVAEGAGDGSSASTSAATAQPGRVWGSHWIPASFAELNSAALQTDPACASRQQMGFFKKPLLSQFTRQFKRVYASLARLERGN